MVKKYWDKLKLVIICIVIVILFGCQVNVSENTEKAIAVEIVEVKKKGISQNAMLNVYLEPKENAIIIPKTPGLSVTSIGVRIGDKVSKGDFLFELDKTMVRRQIDQSRLAYDLARKSYEEQKRKLEELDQSKPTESVAAMYQSRIMGDFNIPTLAQQDKEIALSTLSAQLDQARIAYSTALSQLGEMEYYAPIDGYVSIININENQPILSTQPALIITNIDVLKASVNVSKSLYEQLEEGQPVKINIGSTQVAGRIGALSPIPDRTNNLYSLEIEVDSEQNKSLVGAFSNVLVELDKKEEAIVIPKSTVLEDNNGKYVYIENDNRVYRTNIEIGLDSGNEVEVVKGLKEGDVIVSKGQQFVKDKGLVIIVRGEENEDL